MKKGDTIKLCNFNNLFKNLSNDINITVNAKAEQWCKNNVTTEPIYAELDSPITLEEVKGGIKI